MLYLDEIKGLGKMFNLEELNTLKHALSDMHEQKSDEYLNRLSTDESPQLLQQLRFELDKYVLLSKKVGELLDENSFHSNSL